MKDGRRSPRVVFQVPIRIASGETTCEGRTAVVNRNGALLLCPVKYPDESLEITNMESGETAPFRIVWWGQDDDAGMHKAGTEMLEARPHFWGAGYETKLAELVAEEELVGEE